jgi:pimeloyl-ACP methyl ester carboxylesterase
VAEQPVQVAVDGGVLEGHVGGLGVPALLLHGGPGLPDYMGGCATELGRLFTTIRYTQRGVEPTTLRGPYTVEAHLADALAVLDALGLEQAWAVGHSWGGHLALHLAVAHPERVYGVVAVNPIGAALDVLPELRRALVAKLSEEDRPRVIALEEQLAGEDATDDAFLEQLRLVWPAYFFDPAAAPPPPAAACSIECHRETMASVAEHAEAGTLRKGLREVRLPVLFVHGIDNPLPLRSTLETARLVPGAKMGRVPRCGHFPWLEQPGFLDRIIRGLIARL